MELMPFVSTSTPDKKPKKRKKKSEYGSTFIKWSDPKIDTIGVSLVDWMIVSITQNELVCISIVDSYDTMIAPHTIKLSGDAITSLDISTFVRGQIIEGGLLSLLLEELQENGMIEIDLTMTSNQLRFTTFNINHSE